MDGSQAVLVLTMCRRGVRLEGATPREVRIVEFSCAFLAKPCGKNRSCTAAEEAAAHERIQSRSRNLRKILLLLLLVAIRNILLRKPPGDSFSIQARLLLI